MNHRHSYKNRECSRGIIPPFILEAIARNGNAQQRRIAQQTMAIDAQIRTDRKVAPLTYMQAVAEPCMNRAVYTANHTWMRPGILIRSEGQPPVSDFEANEVYDGLMATFDLYLEAYGRKSIDNNCLKLIATVHYGNPFYNNAFWDNTQMVFGHGDPTIFNRFTMIDVTGHELTHGIANLNYSDQSGALEESLGDVFGSLIKQRYLGQTADQADWLIGAGAWAPGINGIAFRSMMAPGTAYHDPLLASEKAPGGKDPQPDHMRNYAYVSYDNGGVHINSGIPNKAFYLVAIALGGFAWEVAGNIWYRAMQGISPAAQFQDFAHRTASIANTLYGASIRATVVQAWHEVGLLSDVSVHIERSRAFGTPKAAGVPSGIVFPAIGVSNIIYRDTQGRLHELWRQGLVTGTSNLTALAGNAIRAIGDPTTYIDTVENLLTTLYRGTDGHVYSLYWSTGAVGRDALSKVAGAPPAAGKPVGFLQKDGVKVVIYRKGNGHLQSLWWTGPNWPGTEDLMPPGVPAAVGDPSPYINTNTGENIVAYRGTDNHIHTLYWTTGPVGHDNLSGFAGSPKAKGDPVAYYTAHNDTHQVTYRGQNGHLYELWWVGNAPVQAWDLHLATSNAPLAATDPAAYYSVGTNSKHVFYSSANGHLHEIRWFSDGNLEHVDHTIASQSALANDKPSAFTIEGTNSHHIVYRGKDNQIHEIRWILLDNIVRFKNYWKPDQYIHIESGSPQSSPIQPGWLSAQWTLRPVMGANLWRIQNIWKPDQYLHIENGALESGKIAPGWWSAMWSLETIPGAHLVRIRNHWKPDQCLHIENGKLESGTIAPGWLSAMWIVENIR